MKKSPLATIVVVPLVKSVAASKFVVSAVAPDKYLTIFTVAPAFVFVTVDVKEVLVAWAVVRVIAPAVSDPKVAFDVPRVGV
jgi:hypothetical protein